MTQHPSQPEHAISPWLPTSCLGKGFTHPSPPSTLHHLVCYLVSYPLVPFLSPAYSPAATHREPPSLYRCAALATRGSSDMSLDITTDLTSRRLR